MSHDWFATFFDDVYPEHWNGWENAAHLGSDPKGYNSRNWGLTPDARGE